MGTLPTHESPRRSALPSPPSPSSPRDPRAPRGRLAYFVNEYPSPSHTFIRREIHELEARGWEILRFSIRHAPSLSDPADVAERDVTRSLLPLAPVATLAALARLLLRPQRAWAGLRVCVQMARRSDRGLLRAMATFPYAAILLERFRMLGIDHAHAHFPTNSASVLRIVHAMGGPAFSFTVHGPFELEPPSVCSTPEKAREALFVVAISNFTRAQLMRVLPPSMWGKIHVVRCGVEPPVGAASSPIPHDPRVACVARLSEEKGHILLLRAASIVRERGVPIVLELLGDGPLRPLVEQEIGRLGLEDCVHLHGWVDQSTVRDVLAKSRGLVLPSFAEGLPVSIMESLAAGRPVVASRVGAIAELVQHGASGWLVPPGDEAALADGLIELLEAEPSRLEAMGALGRRLVAERHDLARECERLSHLFEDSLPAAAGDASSRSNATKDPFP